jgi:hypothetical protein
VAGHAHMKRPEIERILSTELLKELSAEQFRYAPRTRWLERGPLELQHIISWAYITTIGGSVVQPELGVRSVPVLELFVKASPLRPADQKFRRVLYFAPWRLSGDRKRGAEYRVTSEAEAHQAAAAFAEMVKQDALPWFAQVKSLADIDALLNTEPNSQAARTVNPDNFTRAAHGLIVARLSNNPRYEELVAFYRTMLAEYSGGQFLPEADKLIDALARV